MCHATYTKWYRSWAGGGKNSIAGVRTRWQKGFPFTRLIHPFRSFDLQNAWVLTSCVPDGGSQGSQDAVWHSMGGGNVIPTAATHVPPSLSCYHPAQNAVKLCSACIWKVFWGLRRPHTVSSTPWMSSKASRWPKTRSDVFSAFPRYSEANPGKCAPGQHTFQLHRWIWQQIWRKMQKEVEPSVLRTYQRTKHLLCVLLKRKKKWALKNGGSRHDLLTHSKTWYWLHVF